jgi:hypothetical protein
MWTVTATDLASLLPSKCPTKNIVNCCLQLFSLQSNSELGSAFHLWPSISDLEETNDVRKLTDIRYHLVPIFVDMSWSLAKIDMHDQMIELYDPLAADDPTWTSFEVSTALANSFSTS